MKVLSFDRDFVAGDDGQPLNTPDLAQSELFLSALNAPPPGGDGAAGGDTLGVGQLAGAIRRGATSVSNDWYQAKEKAADLARRPKLDSTFMSDLLGLTNQIARADVKLYLCTKIAAKCTQTVDVLSRG